MITGVWISPDRLRMAVQFEEDSIAIVDAQFEQLLDIEEACVSGQVPVGWEPLYEPEEGT